MALVLYDESLEVFTTNPMRSFHDGYLGTPHEQIFYIRNHDPAYYYTDITIAPEMIGGYNDAGEFGTSGWGIKLMYGKRRPTEAEWDLVRSSDGIEIPDIGTTEAADTFAQHPVWVRIYCPGGELAQIRENMQLRIRYYVRSVGA